jgi:diacylglycerol kinase (ATP)
VRAHLIVNPMSGANRGLPLLPRITKELRVDEVTVTEGKDDAFRAAVRAANEGCDALYVAGGDGTLNEAIRGIAAVGGAFERMAIGVIPLGTGNDFAKALDLGEQPEAALARLNDRNTVRVDLGLLGDRPFVNISAGGFVADVSGTVTPGLKDAIGKLAYVIGGARALLGTEPFSARMTVAGAAGAATAHEGLELQMFAVCNARFIGGGYRIAPGAAIDDGLLDVVLVRRSPLIEFVAVLQKLAAGSHDSERILHFRLREFELVFDRQVRVNTDGELLEADRCRYRVLPRTASFFCGPAPDTVMRPSSLVI